MSDIIQLLPDSVANQIAAGEVIQRPASVIKELVENAVDAGADTIHVVVTDAGRTAIQVIDNGSGMTETDARLAFERHATSKIRQADDLFALHTMGFRGEALPSIAAVAQVQLTTRTADDEIGTRLTIQGSQVVAQEPVSCPVGSNFSVENLFFNVPARRKFLKSNATELTNILTAFERIVLVYPEINFTMHSNSQELLNLKKGTIRQRIADIFGKNLSQDLLPVDVQTTLCTISGFVGKPEAARKKGAHQYFFVNGRYMKHPYFHKAVQTAFERLVPQGMQVPYFIYFDVSPADIDVNIHPTKTEIKFENEQPIFQILLAAVKDAVGRFSDIPSIDFDTEGKPDIPVYAPHEGGADMPRVNLNPSYNPFTSRSSASTSAPAVPRDWQTLYDVAAKREPRQEEETLFPDAGEERPTPEKDDMGERSPLHYQYKGQWIMTAVKSGLMVVDQHRASLRILYEQYLRQMENHSGRVQRLLFPEVVQFSTADSVLLIAFMPQLQAMGFELSNLGGGSYAVSGIPAGLEGMNPVALVQQVVGDAIDLGAAPSESDLNHSLALSLARSAAVPVGQVLTNDEMEHLTNELFRCQASNYTPDGHPIIGILPHTDIERLF